MLAAWLLVASSDVSGRPLGQAPTPTPPTERGPTIYLPVLQRSWSTATSTLGDPGAPGLGNPGYDVDSYDVRLAFHIDPGTVGQGGQPPRVEYTAVAFVYAYTNVDRVDQIALDFVLPSGPVDVLLDDAPVRWWAGAGNKVWVALPPNWARGTRFNIRFQYKSSAGFSVRRASQDNADSLQIWTPVGNAGSWFPGNHHPRDRAEFSFTLTAPDPYLAVANGRRVNHFHDSGATTSVFFTKRQMATADAMVNIGRYIVDESESESGVPLMSYTFRPVDEAKPTIQALTRQLEWFGDRLFGNPYGNMTFVETGATGSASLAGMFVVGRNQANVRTVYWERNAALMARQWFGAAVGVQNRGDDWLNTGLTTYLGYLYQARDQGPEIIRARLAALESAYAFGVTRDVALSDLPGDGSASTQAVAANKAPWAYHNVRWRLGDDVFWQVLRDYIKKTPQLLASLPAFEAAAIDNLTEPPDFFRAVLDIHFRAAKTPRMNLAWSRAGGTARARVCQLTAEPNGIVLPLQLYGSSGTALGTLVVRKVDEAFEIPYDGTLSALTPDPDQIALADIIVHPMGDAPLPECAALPQPAIATGGAAAMGASGAVVEAGGLHGDGAGDGTVFDVGTDDETGAVARAMRKAHALRHFQPALDADTAVETAADNVAADNIAADVAADVAHPHAAVPGEPSIGDPYIPYLGNTGYDVITYTVKARIDPVAGRVDADTTVQARSVISGLSRISLDFIRMSADGTDGLAITAVEVDGRAATYERPADVDKLWLDLPQPLADGQAFTMRFVYGGEPREGGTDIFSGGLMPHSQQTMYAISEPNGTRNWIPCNDHPRDKAVFRFEITVPAPFRSAANGVLVEERSGETESTAIFEMRQPMSTYLAGAAVGRYRTADQAGPDGVTIRHYFLNEPAVGMRVVDVTPDILSVFGRLVAPYAFDSYGHFAAPDFGGGMENQSMTAIGANVFTTRTPRNSYSLIAHEAAHQWFGDAISPYSWADIWLNEGFATYFAELWRADRVGPEPLGWRMEGLRYAILNGGANAPVSQPIPADMFGTNTYEKGGWVLHMLRAQLGEEAFWKGLRAYYAAFEYGNAKTDDLEAALAAEAAGTGVNVGAAFDQWVHRAGQPVVYAGWTQGDDDVVRVRLCQSEPAFDLPITVAAHQKNGSLRASGRLAGAQSDLEVSTTEFPFKDVTGVTVDPDVELLADIRVVRLADGAATACDAVAAAWAAGGKP